MYNKYKGLTHFIVPTVAAVTFFVLRLVKFSPIIGSSWGFFSLFDAAMPLTGTLGLSFGLCMVMARMGCKAFFTGVSLSHVVYYVPGFCGAGYWAHKNVLFRLLVPISCMVAFVMHPVGYQAAAYSLYWLIPVGIYFYKSESIFLKSLASTFVVHAVGSVIWLYSFDMSAQMWLALIPVVAVERLFFASAMTVFYSTVRECKRMVLKTVFSSSQLV